MVGLEAYRECTGSSVISPTPFTFTALCSDTAELIFEDVRSPAENVLGEVNKGFYAVMKNFQNERIVLGAMACAEA